MTGPVCEPLPWPLAAPVQMDLPREGKVWSLSFFDSLTGRGKRKEIYNLFYDEQEETALAVYVHPNSLLAHRSVRRLSRAFRDEVLQIQEEKRGAEERSLEKTAEKYARIFCGENPHYPPAKGWTGEALANFVLANGLIRPKGLLPTQPFLVLKTYFREMAGLLLKARAAYGAGQYVSHPEAGPPECRPVTKEMYDLVLLTLCRHIGWDMRGIYNNVEIFPHTAAASSLWEPHSWNAESWSRPLERETEAFVVWLLEGLTACFGLYSSLARYGQVRKICETFRQDVLEVKCSLALRDTTLILGREDEKKLAGVVEKYRAIFAGENPDYAREGEWSGDRLGYYLRDTGYVRPDPNKGTFEEGGGRFLAPYLNGMACCLLKARAACKAGAYEGGRVTPEMYALFCYRFLRHMAGDLVGWHYNEDEDEDEDGSVEAHRVTKAETTLFASCCLRDLSDDFLDPPLRHTCRPARMWANLFARKVVELWNSSMTGQGRGKGEFEEKISTLAREYAALYSEVAPEKRPYESEARRRDLRDWTDSLMKFGWVRPTLPPHSPIRDILEGYFQESAHKLVTLAREAGREGAYQQSICRSVHQMENDLRFGRSKQTRQTDQL